MGDMRNAYTILVGNHKVRRSLGRPMHKWKHNIKIDIGEVGWESVDWIHLAHSRENWRALVNTMVKLGIP
jgi:hypothetical protein